MKTIDDILLKRAATPRARAQDCRTSMAEPGCTAPGLLRALAARLAGWRERRKLAGAPCGTPERELADAGLDGPARPPALPLFNEVEERVLADLGLSRILPPPAGGR